MTRTVEAVYEGGVLRPLEPLDDLPDKSYVRITIHPRDCSGRRVAECAGSLSLQAANELKQIIERDFERTVPAIW